MTTSASPSAPSPHVPRIRCACAVHANRHGWTNQRWHPISPVVRQMQKTAIVLVALSLAVLGGIAPREARAEQDAVESARETFQRRGIRPPWYDAESDGLRPVKIRQPPPAPSGRQPVSFLSGQAIVTAMIVVLVIIVVVLVVAWLYSLRDRPKTDRPGAKKILARGRSEGLPEHIDETIGDWEAAIRAAVDRGDYRRAAVLLFSYELVELDRNQLIRLERGKTNRQYLHELRKKTSLRGALEEAMVLFEDAYFGGRAVEAERFERCWARFPEFRRMMLETTA